MAGASVLDREMYSEAEAARLLGVAQNTLNCWLEGGERRGKSYPPVIRSEPRGHRAPVTWAEFGVRFYVDADVLGLAKLLVQVRNDVTYPGDPGGVMHRRQRPACKIASPAVLDRDWIPQVAAEGWSIITRDRHPGQPRRNRGGP